MGFGGVFLAHVGGRLVVVSGHVDGEVADGGQSMSRAAGASAAEVFAELGIEDVEAAFDEPAAAQMLQQERSIGFVAREAGDRIGRRRAGLALRDRPAFEADNLLRTGPVEIAGIDHVGGRGDGSCFDAATALFGRRGGLPNRQFFLNCIGGKSPRGWQRRAQYHAAVGADCPSP